MKKHSEQIDRYFKERFEQFEQQPEEAVWKHIAAKLGHNRKRRTAILIFRIAAGMALIISLGVGFFLINRKGHQIVSPALSDLHSNISITDSLVVPERTSEQKPAVIMENNTGKSDRLLPVRRIFPDRHTKTEDIEENNLKNMALWKSNRFREAQSAEHMNFAEIIHPAHRGLIPSARSADRFVRSYASAPDNSSSQALTETMTESGPVAVPDKPKHDRWVLGSEVAPLYSYRTITSDQIEPEMLSTLNKSEKGLIAMAGGLRVAFLPNRRLSIQSGVYYSRYGQEKNKVETYHFNNTENSDQLNSDGSYLAIVNSTGTIYNTQPENRSFDQVAFGSYNKSNENFYLPGIDGSSYTAVTSSQESNVNILQYFDYLEIPLTLKYKIIDRKLDFSLSGGLVTNFLVGNVVKMEQDGEKSRFGKTNGISQINYLSSFGLGLEYPLMKGVAFSLEPRFRYYINPIDRTSQINIHPYSFGIFAGLNYIF